MKELSFVLFEQIRAEQAKKSLPLEQTIMIYFFKYLMTNIRESDERKFTLTCHIIVNFQEFENRTELALLLFFLQQSMQKSELRYEYQKIIKRYIVANYKRGRTSQIDQQE